MRRSLLVMSIPVLGALIAGWLLMPIPHAAPTWRWSERPWFANGDVTYRGLRAAWPKPWPVFRGNTLTVYYDVERNLLCCVSDPNDKAQPSISSDAVSTWIAARGINHHFIAEADTCLVLVKFGENEARQLNVRGNATLLKSEFARYRHSRVDSVVMEDAEIQRRVVAIAFAEDTEKIRQFLSAPE
jgi:hypothetical protein